MNEHPSTLIHKSVLADTTPLYTVFKQSNQSHARSQAELQQFEPSNIEILLLYSTLLEAYTPVLQRFGIHQTSAFKQMAPFTIETHHQK